jgi:hypothetical protein
LGENSHRFVFCFWQQLHHPIEILLFTETAFFISLLIVTGRQPCHHYPAISPRFSTTTSTSHHSSIMAAKGQKFSFGRLINNMVPNFAKDSVDIPQVSICLSL